MVIFIEVIEKHGDGRRIINTEHIQAIVENYDGCSILLLGYNIQTGESYDDLTNRLKKISQTLS